LLAETAIASHWMCIVFGQWLPDSGQMRFESQPIRQRQTEMKYIKNTYRKQFFSLCNYPRNRPITTGLSVAEVCSKNGQVTIAASLS